MSEEKLQQHKIIWRKKPIIKFLYTQWYKEIASQLIPGKTLELGGGTGNFKEFFPNVISTDIVPVPWIDCIADAQNLPFENNSFDNIVMFDVLHHIENVSLFFNESLRVLRPEGRVAIMEPYISPVSWWVYHFIHPEPVDLKQDPLILIPPSPVREPFDSNQAFATILFEKRFDSFQKRYPQFKKVYYRRMAFFVYPLSGGFEKRSLVPPFLIQPLLFLENIFSFLSRFLAFRVLCILEKT